MKLLIHGHNLGSGDFKYVKVSLGDREVSIHLRESHVDRFQEYWVRKFTDQWVQHRMRCLRRYPQSLTGSRYQAHMLLERCLAYKHKSSASLANGLHGLRLQLHELMPHPTSRYFPKSEKFIQDLMRWIDEHRTNAATSHN